MEFISVIIDWIVQILYLALFARVLLSWLPINPYNTAIEIINLITDPLIRPFQNILPGYKLGIDFSPFFAGIAIGLARQLLLIFTGL